MEHSLFRKILATGIVMLFAGTIGMMIFSRNISLVGAQATIYVDDDNATPPWDGSWANPYQHIQEGINAASNGDTVYVLNGTYHENVVLNKSITLTGESKPAIDGMGGLNSRGIDITANNVTVEGFNITNSDYGIYCNVSGFSITNNVFWYDSYGFYWRISESNLAEDYTVHASTVKNNEFYMSVSNDAVYIYVSLNYGYNSGYDVVIGDITVCENTFHMDGTTATGIQLDEAIYVSALYGGTISVGTLNASGNTMYGGRDGIYFFGLLEDIMDVQASVGDFIVNNNVLVNQSSSGVRIDYYDAYYWNGTTTGTYGDLIVRGNTITSEYSAQGIVVADVGYWEYFDDDASLEVGNVYIEENEIDVGSDGIEFIGYDAGYDMYGNSSIAMDSIFVNDNTIKSGDDGIYGSFDYFGNYMYGNSSFTMGNIEFCRNTINSTSEGIYIYQFNYFGYEMNGSSSFVMGSILVNKNTIHSGSEGIYIYQFSEIGYYMYDNSTFTMGNIQFNDNTIHSNDYGIYVDYFDYFGEDMYGSSSWVMGNIEFCQNEINSTYEGIYVYEFYDFGYDRYDDSISTMGSILLNDNIIHSGDEGIYVYYFEYFGEDMYDNASFTMGNIEFNNNTIHSGSEGIYVEYFDYFGNYMNGNASFTMGNIEFCQNKINSTNGGIYIYDFYEFGYEMNGTSSFVMGNILVNDNIIHSGSEGIYVDYFDYFGEYMYDNASFTMGNIEFCRNVINSTYDGIYISEFYDFGYYLYDNSSFTMGSILVKSNTINSSGAGIYVYQFEYFGEDLYGSSSWLMGNIQFNDNTIHSQDHGIYMGYIDFFGSDMTDNSTLTIGSIEFSGNVINSTYHGIYFTRIARIADGLYNNTLFTMGNFSVNDNVITCGDDGIHLDYLAPFGIDVYDDAVFVMGDIVFDGNLLSNCSAGMSFMESENAVIRNNIIQNCDYGIYLVNSTNNRVYHNNFLNNAVQAYVTLPYYTNAWDDGYPSGGNYWSEYTDVDQYSGPGQNVTGSDGIWDNPYIINAYNQDNYPFASNWTWDTEPPSISAVSQDPEIPDNLEPVTITVSVTDAESGAYHVTLSYSTDGGDTWNNVTMQNTMGDTYQGELPGLPDGTYVQYKITAYDVAGNSVVEDNAGSYYIYTVIPEFTLAIIVPLFMLFALIAAAQVTKKRCKITTKTL